MGLACSPTFTIKNQPNVGKYTSPMDPMGLNHLVLRIRSQLLEPCSAEVVIKIHRFNEGKRWKLSKSGAHYIPFAPWDWNIYLHEWRKNVW